MKRRIGILCFLFCMILVSCQKKNTEFRMTEELDGQEREEVNAMIGTFASDGEDIYIIGSDIIGDEIGSIVYRVDMEKRELVVNCGDVLCNHESMECSARLPLEVTAWYTLQRNGQHVYAIGSRILEIDKNSKKEIGSGSYGLYGNKILFGDYIAYFEEEDIIAVKHMESGKEVQRFEGIHGYTQGSFYYRGCLYYVTDMNQLAKLDIKTGDIDIVEKKGATRASVYQDFIYYIKVSEETDTNCLIKMNPETLEKQELAESVFYYNMHGEDLYYISYPEKQFYCMSLNGENQKEIPVQEGYEFWDLSTFAQTEYAILHVEDAYTYYLFNMDSGEIDYEEPIIDPGKPEEEEIPAWML